MKTILLICPFARPNIGGVESHLDKLISCISRKNYHSILVTYQPLTSHTRGEKFEKVGTSEIHRVSWFGTGLFPRLEPYFPLVFIYLFPALFIKSLRIYLRNRKRIDVIHAHGFIAAAVARALAMIARKRMVVSTHAIYRLERRKTLAPLVRSLLIGFDVILAVGEPSRRELANIGLPIEKIRTYFLWFDTDRFKPLDGIACRGRLGLGRDGFVVLFAGRLLEIKGINILLEAARKTDKDVRFVFVGEGPMAGPIESSARMNDKVVFLGKLTEDELIEAYNAADLFVSPVLYEEGFATVYLEALACGTPVVTSRSGCLPYFLSPDVADLMDRPAPDSLLDLIERHLENRVALRDRREICRRYAEEKFSERNAEIIIDSYRP
ncbi:MAG: glycosyltransferase family 4 protein [bacterium]